jgi:hypothetical protein
LSPRATLKVYGIGEWQIEKHGGRGKRSWRKLHLAVDPDRGEILASELMTQDEGDASLIGPLLDQIDRPIVLVTADGPYDGGLSRSASRIHHWR